ncbi:AAA family ATPase [Candidatus Bathyarchaeota archaeon]|nr:AAA family ATPase [Candidatus Bathyarchaeota archaeon]
MIIAIPELMRARYHPETLPHREPEIKKLDNIYRRNLLYPIGKCSHVTRVLGPVGSGKTCTVKTFTHRIKKDTEKHKVPLRIVYVNCKLGVKDRRSLYSRILEAITGKTPPSYSPGEYLDRITKYLAEEDLYLFLVLDDVDYLIRRDKRSEPEGGLVYDLTRLGEYYPRRAVNILGVVFIAQEQGFRDVLDQSERSSLGFLVIRLKGYDKEELLDILRSRVYEAFNITAVPGEVLEYVCDLTTHGDYKGDCRYALGLLHTGGLIADESMSDQVQVDHIRKAVSETCWGPSMEELYSLDMQQLLILLAIVQALRVKARAYVMIRSVYDFYTMLSSTYDVEPLSYTRVKHLIKELEHLVGIDYVPGKGVRLMDASLDDFERVIERALQQVTGTNSCNPPL